MLSTPYGISSSGRAELATAIDGLRFITPSGVASRLGIDSRIAARKLAHWAEGGWLRRVRRGLYIPVPVEAAHPERWTQDAMVVATAVWSPCYFTGFTAANYRSLTEQVFRRTVVKTSQRVRLSNAQLLDYEYLLVHVSDAAMTWGIESVWDEEVRLSIADPARVVIDILDSPRLGGGIRHCAEILSSYFDEHDPRVLIDYGDRLGNHAVFKRLGYLVEALGLDQRELVSACRKRLSAGIAVLDPSGPPNGRRVSSWAIRANVHIEPAQPS